MVHVAPYVTLGQRRTRGSQSSCRLADNDEGKDAEAKLLYERALTLGGQALGPSHPDVISMQEKYARLLQRENNKE